MKCLLPFTAAILLWAPITAADPLPVVPETQSREDISAFKLPSKDEIEQLKKELPIVAEQMNEVMGTLMGAMKDERIRGGMEQSLGALKNHMDNIDLGAQTEDGLPDFAVLMGTMLELMGDDEFREGLEDAIGPLQEMAETLAPEQEADWQ